MPYTVIFLKLSLCILFHFRCCSSWINPQISLSFTYYFSFDYIFAVCTPVIVKFLYFCTPVFLLKIVFILPLSIYFTIYIFVLKFFLFCRGWVLENDSKTTFMLSTLYTTEHPWHFTFCLFFPIDVSLILALHLCYYIYWLWVLKGFSCFVVNCLSFWLPSFLHHSVFLLLEAFLKCQMTFICVHSTKE